MAHPQPILKGQPFFHGVTAKEAEISHRALQLHNGHISILINPEHHTVTMQIDEKKDSKPIIFNLANNTISNVTVIPPE
jgi:hypothetical protein